MHKCESYDELLHKIIQRVAASKSSAADHLDALQSIVHPINIVYLGSASGCTSDDAPASLLPRQSAVDRTEERE